MSTLFDTLRVTKDLQSSGFDTRQSEGIVAALESSLESAVATKADVTAVRSEIAQQKTELKADNGTLRTEVKAEIDTLRTEVKAEIHAQANKTILAVIAVAAVVLAAIKLL